MSKKWPIITRFNSVIDPGSFNILDRALDAKPELVQKSFTLGPTVIKCRHTISLKVTM